MGKYRIRRKGYALGVALSSQLAAAAGASTAARPAATTATTATAAIRIGGSASIACRTRGNRRVIGPVEVGLVLFVDRLVGLLEVVAALDHDGARV